MRLRGLSILVLLIGTTPAVCHGPTWVEHNGATDAHTDRQTSLAETPPRQNSVAVESVHPRMADTELDLAPSGIEFEHASYNALIHALVSSGHTTLHLPGQGLVTLEVDKHTQSYGADLFTLSFAGLPSTLTRRGDRLHLSLATPYGSYRITAARAQDGEGITVQSVANIQIAQRMVNQEKDFLHVEVR